MISQPDIDGTNRGLGNLCVPLQGCVCPSGSQDIEPLPPTETLTVPPTTASSRSTAAGGAPMVSSHRATPATSPAVVSVHPHTQITHRSSQTETLQHRSFTPSLVVWMSSWKPPQWGAVVLDWVKPFQRQRASIVRLGFGLVGLGFDLAPRPPSAAHHICTCTNTYVRTYL